MIDVAARLCPDLPGFTPDWPLPMGVKAWQSTRGEGGLPYGGFNLGMHVGDDPLAVLANRQRLQTIVPSQPVWLEQVHGTHVVTLNGADDPLAPTGDAVMTTTPGVVCAIMTADCLPVLMADQQGRIVGAAHAGWRGLAAGVLDSLVAGMCRLAQETPVNLTAWLGPAIGPTAFEVGREVRDAFLTQSPDHAVCFSPRADHPGKWLADLPQLATQKLNRLGVTAVTDSNCCTYRASEYYSYRREKITGRMASMIWIDA